MKVSGLEKDPRFPKKQFSDGSYYHFGAKTRFKVLAAPLLVGNVEIPVGAIITCVGWDPEKKVLVCTFLRAGDRVVNATVHGQIANFDTELVSLLTPKG